MKNLIIVGAGGFGRELLQWCKEINDKEKRWNIKGFIDDNLNALDGVECDYEVLGAISSWIPKKSEVFAIAIAAPLIKEKVVKLLESKGAVFESIIHHDARIGCFNKIGKGVVIYPGARITVNAVIGDYVTILDLATVGHDSHVGDYSIICGGCGINGHVTIEDHVFFGSHSTTAPGVCVKSGAYVGTGSAVVSTVKSNTRVFGVPAKKIIL